MKNLIRTICRNIAHRLYLYFLEEKKKKEMDMLSGLKACGDAMAYKDGCQFLGTEYISIGSNCSFGRGCRIEAVGSWSDGRSFSPNLVIGNYVTMEDWCHIGCIGTIEIGDGTMLASRVFITDHYHGNISSEDLKYSRPILRPLSSKPVIVGRNVWIGEGVCIMPGVTLGDNVIVGANSVVTHSFGPNTVIAGCPARAIKELI